MKDTISPMALLEASAAFAILAVTLTRKLYPDDDIKIEIER